LRRARSERSLANHSMKPRAIIGHWVSKRSWRIHVLFILLMLLPIAIFAFSVSRVLRHQAEAHAINESGQIAHVSAALVEEHFRQSTAFLESIASRPSFRAALHQDPEMLDSI
jgi:nitrate/nitrite-specific signal transduction histidine kinase